jgi:hypothetical protein
VYVLWLGYRDHVALCEEESHEQCMPDLARSYVRY